MKIGFGVWIFLFFICLADGWVSAIVCFTVGPILGWIVGELINEYQDKKAIEKVNKREKKYSDIKPVSAARCRELANEYKLKAKDAATPEEKNKLNTIAKFLERQASSRM